MKPTKILILIGMLIASVATHSHAGELTLIVTEKSQDSILKEDGSARYTVRYISTDSQRTNSHLWVIEEPRESSTGIQYRGAVDRTVIFPDKFAQVGDIICQTNIGGKMYLHAVTPTVKRNDVSKRERPQSRNKKRGA